MKYVIWGAGIRGKRVFPHIGSDYVEAFIDMNKEKIGQEYLGKKIISLEEYKEKFSQCYIVISYSHENEIVEILKENNIHKYFLLSDCPGEFQESNTRDLLKNYVSKNLNKDKNYAIYGYTLYAFILNRWIITMTGKDAFFIPHKGLSDSEIDKIREDFSAFKFIKIDEVSKYGIEEVLVVREPDIDYLNSINEILVKFTNIYDCSDRIEAYFNPASQAYKDINKGERCFIVATGPSLKMQDLDILNKNEVKTFSMNRIWYAFSKTSWKPDYYVVSDFRFLEEDEKELELLPVYHKFVADTYAPYWEKKHSKNIIKYHYHYEYVPDRIPKFSEDFSRKVYHGCSVTYVCIQLAIYMGFSEIYLLGVDATTPGKYHDNSSHFCKEYISKSQSELMCFVDEPRWAYEAAKTYAKKHNIKIYNATRGGELEVFERVDFDKLFKENV